MLLSPRPHRYSYNERYESISPGYTRSRSPRYLGGKEVLTRSPHYREEYGRNDRRKFIWNLESLSPILRWYIRIICYAFGIACTSVTAYVRESWNSDVAYVLKVQVTIICVVPKIMQVITQSWQDQDIIGGLHQSHHSIGKEGLFPKTLVGATIGLDHQIADAESIHDSLQSPNHYHHLLQCHGMHGAKGYKNSLEEKWWCNGITPQL